jgi:hypothetical protein
MEPPGPSEPSDVPPRFHVDFTGKTLGAYRVEKRLAEGAMGGVYLAEDTNLGMRVVVKVPHARFLGEPGFRARFRREIAELVRLEHQHVVRILARGEEDDVPYFVLQYLGGGSLEERLKAGGPQSLPATLAWLRPTAATLDFVHARGVVHRDVKPGNILFDEQGDVFLSDFGLVKALDRREDGKLTEAGTGIGSPLYMAPEQGLGRDVTGAADQYGLASTLYEALAGHPPFRGGTVIETLVRKQRDPAPGVRDLAPDVPPAAEAAIRRALDADPGKRFPTCAAFAEEVARSASPAAPAPRPWPVWAAPAAAVLVAAVGVGAATGWYGLAPTPAGSGPAAAARAGARLVVLAKAGEEPRRVRRFRPVAGSTERFVHRESSDFRMTGEPAEKESSEQRVTVLVPHVHEGGFDTRWTLHVPRAGKGEGASDEAVAAQQAEYDEVGELEVVASVTSRGEVVDPRVSGSGRVAPEESMEALDQADLLHEMEVVFPEEPIGVGAVWDVTKAATMMGLRYQQTVTYELTSVEGERLGVKFVGRMGLPPQEWSPPGVPKEARVTVRSARMLAEGTALLDLLRAGVVEWTMKLDAEIAFEAVLATGDEPPVKATLTGTDVSSLRRE